MIVVLSDCIFSTSSPETAIELTVLVSNSRHIVIADVNTTAFREWSQVAGSFGPRLEALVVASNKFVVAGVVHTRILVHAARTNWSAQVPRLSIEDARSYIPIPFKIFVENNDADKAFLLAFLDDDRREELLELQLNHWVVFVHGGGTGDLQKQIAWEAENTMRADLRSFAYFDNDGLLPQSPSAKTLQIAAECSRHNIKFHQLIRRAIENYIPISALELWASTQGSKRANHTRRQLTPFKKLSESERDYFNMKSGPHGDAEGIVYPALSQYELRQLKKGFGKKVATIYSHENFRGKSIRQDFQRAAAEIRTLYMLLRTRI